MSKVTVKQLKKDAAELLRLQPMIQRYRELEQMLKDGMIALGHTQIEITGQGRVFVSVSKRETVSPELVRELLGEQMASKIIQRKETVPNRLIEAFVEVGDIEKAERDRLMAEAERREVVNLYVRPLK